MQIRPRILFCLGIPPVFAEIVIAVHKDNPNRILDIVRQGSPNILQKRPLLVAARAIGIVGPDKDKIMEQTRSQQAVHRDFLPIHIHQFHTGKILAACPLRPLSQQVVYRPRQIRELAPSLISTQYRLDMVPVKPLVVQAFGQGMNHHPVVQVLPAQGIVQSYAVRKKAQAGSRR